MKIRTLCFPDYLLIALFASVAACFDMGTASTGILLIGLVNSAVLPPMTTRILRLKLCAERIRNGALDEPFPVDANDELGALAASLSDMTDALKQSRHEAPANIDNLKDILHSIKDSLIAVNPDGTLQFVNSAACGLFGSEQPFASMMEQLPGEALAKLRFVLSGRSPGGDQTYRHQPEGAQPLWLRMTVTPLRNSGSGAVIVHRDVTAYLQGSDHLQKSPPLPEELSKHIPGLLYQYRLLPDGRYCMPYASERITDFFGVTPEEARSDATAVLRSLHPKDRETLVTSIKDSAKNRISWQQEFRVEQPNKDVLWLHAESRLQQLEDDSLLWHGIARDITEHKLLESELHKAQADLETRIAERNARLLAANTQLDLRNQKVRQEIMERMQLEQKLKESHDLQVLLAAELNMSEERERRRIAITLHDSVVQDLALGKLRLDMTLKEGKAAYDVLESLVTLIEKAIEQIRGICYDLSPPLLYDLGLTQAVESLGERLARQYGFGFTLQEKLEAAPLPDHVRIVLYQAAKELLINVVKHAHARRVIVQIQQKLGMVQLSIIDDGVGFPPSAGKGFGLSHVEQRIGFLSGTMRIISAPGRKTVVTVVVPMAEGKKQTGGRKR